MVISRSFLRPVMGLTLTAALVGIGVGIGGCRGGNPAGVPRDAIKVAGGRPGEARRLDYTCSADGTAYVTDDWDNSLVYSGPVHKGDRVAVDVNAGRITVNGRAVYERPMRHTDHFILVVRGAASPS